jgi:DNA primase
MGKISQVAAKYIVHATINIEGVVDRPDVIGAIFGQTEGLLGEDLELRELQRSGRIGRIEVKVDTRGGKTQGSIIIPSSLDKAETAIIGAALEVIQRIGPCNASLKVNKIEDVRVSKRSFVIDRAKELLKNLMDNSLPDSQELADKVSSSVRVMEVREWGPDRLAAGPNIDDSDDIVLVEGRADVINMLKHGFKNGIAVNGTTIPASVAELGKKKTVTVFVDGDRGGELIVKALTAVTDVDFVAKAPDGKEVEEITKKEIHKALRGKVSAEQAELDVKTKANGSGNVVQRARPVVRPSTPVRHPERRYVQSSPVKRYAPAVKTASDSEKKKFKEMFEDLIGTKGAYILDENLSILGKVPISELENTVKNLGSGVYAIVLDGSVERELVKSSERTAIKHLIGTDSKIKSGETRLNILTVEAL